MAQITANFNDRDSANLTLMRLRRGGIDFDLVSLKTSASLNSTSITNGISYPICFGMNSLSAANGSQNVAAPEANPTEMQISVKSGHLQQAWDVLRSTGARDIRSRN